MARFYQQDLAYIHDIGFTEYARQSMPGILTILKDNQITEGSIVELGCGSGLSAQELIAANYQVLGVDISESMIEIARKRVPQAEFIVKSLFKVDIPACNAVLSVGECLNYLFDGNNNLLELFDRIYRALNAGGLLIFDLLQPGQSENLTTQGFKAGTDWLVCYQKDEDPDKQILTRNIISFRKIGEWYRKSEEIHRVKLYPVQEIVDRLTQVGFQVQVLSGYGNFKLSPAHAVFVASKPKN